MTSIRRILGGAALLTSFTVAASAAPIIQTISFPGPGNAQTNQQVTSWSNTFGFSTFNTNLGTLTGILLTITDAMSGTVVITNNSGSASTYNATLLTNSYFSLNSALLGQDPNNFAPGQSGVNTFFADQVSKTSNSIPIANGGTGSSTLSGHSTTGAEDPQTGGDFNNNTALLDSLFSTNGAGTINFYEIVGGKSGEIGASPSTAVGTPTAGTTITLEYDYTPPSGVPEPATMALFGSALVGLGMLRKRARKN